MPDNPLVLTEEEREEIWQNSPCPGMGCPDIDQENSACRGEVNAFARRIIAATLRKVAVEAMGKTMAHYVSEINELVIEIDIAASEVEKEIEHGD